jgi:hypothetical protein
MIVPPQYSVGSGEWLLCYNCSIEDEYKIVVYDVEVIVLGTIA